MVFLIGGAVLVAVIVWVLLALPGGLSAFGRSADLGPRGDASRRLWNEDELSRPRDQDDVL